MGHERVDEALVVLREAGIPGYAFPERAVATLGAMQDYRRHLDRGARQPASVDADRDTVSRIIAQAKADRRSFITEESGARIAAAYGIPVARGTVARDFDAAAAFANDVGYPVVAKIASPDILHKSDVGGIRAGIENESELAEAYDEILSKARAYMPEAVILGMQVQEMVTVKREVIIGVDRDPTFGPLLMFGLGGIFVEVLKDVTFRMCPVDPVSAREMMAEIRGFGLLRGARGQHPADLEAMADVIVRISALVTDFPEIIELDINPLMVGDSGQGAVAADIRIGIGG
jgi:acetyltransferase